MWDRRGLPRYQEGRTAEPWITNPEGLKLRDVLEAARYQPGEIESVLFREVVFTPEVLELMRIYVWVGVDEDEDDGMDGMGKLKYNTNEWW